MFQTRRIRDIFTRMNFITSRRNTVDDVETTHTSPSHAALQVSQYSTTRTIRASFYLRQRDYVFIGVCYGRTLSERPCYILPMFFFLFFYARLSWPIG